MDALQASLRIAGSGLEAQSIRMRVVTENLANANSTGPTPGSDPYSRKTVTFASELERASGATLVKVDSIGEDDGPFRVEHHAGHPAADKDGMAKFPNISMLIEMADMREASRSYEANLQIIKQAREMITATIDLLRGS